MLLLLLMMMMINKIIIMIITAGVIMIISSPLPDRVGGMKIKRPSQEPADLSPDLAKNVHRRARLQDSNQDEEGYADRDERRGESPVGYRDGDGRHAEYALQEITR